MVQALSKHGPTACPRGCKQPHRRTAKITEINSCQKFIFVASMGHGSGHQTIHHSMCMPRSGWQAGESYGCFTAIESSQQTGLYSMLQGTTRLTELNLTKYMIKYIEIEVSVPVGAISNCYELLHSIDLSWCVKWWCLNRTPGIAHQVKEVAKHSKSEVAAKWLVCTMA
jgi:hypothetical protein